MQEKVRCVRINKQQVSIILLNLIFISCSGTSGKNQAQPVPVVPGGMTNAKQQFFAKGKTLAWGVYEGQTFYMTQKNLPMTPKDKALKDEYLERFRKNKETKHQFCNGQHDQVQGQPTCHIKIRKIVALRIVHVRASGLSLSRSHAIQLYCSRNTGSSSGLILRQDDDARYFIDNVDDILGVLVFGSKVKIHDPYHMTWQPYQDGYQSITSHGYLMQARIIDNHLTDVQWAKYQGGQEDYQQGVLVGGTQ